MTFACQKRGGEVTPSAYDDGEGRRRRGEWGHEPSFPEVGGGQQDDADGDGGDEPEGREKHNHEGKSENTEKCGDFCTCGLGRVFINSHQFVKKGDVRFVGFGVVEILLSRGVQGY